MSKLRSVIIDGVEYSPKCDLRKIIDEYLSMLKRRSEMLIYDEISEAKSTAFLFAHRDLIKLLEAEQWCIEGYDE